MLPVSDWPNKWLLCLKLKFWNKPVLKQTPVQRQHDHCYQWSYTTGLKMRPFQVSITKNILIYFVGEGNQVLYWPLRSISPVLWQGEDTAHGMQPLSHHCHYPHWLGNARNRHAQNQKKHSNTPQDGKIKPSRKAAGHLKSFLSSP